MRRACHRCAPTQYLWAAVHREVVPCDPGAHVCLSLSLSLALCVLVVVIGPNTFFGKAAALIDEVDKTGHLQEVHADTVRPLAHADRVHTQSALRLIVFVCAVV
jgi:hypothetical protein